MLHDFVIYKDFIIYIKTGGVYEEIAYDLEKRFDTSNYEVNRPLPTRKNKKLLD